MKRAILIQLLLLISGGLIAQFTVTGTVTDETGLSAIGAAVIVKGTTIGTVTDVNGKYNISCPGADATLIFFLIGIQ